MSQVEDTKKENMQEELVSEVLVPEDSVQEDIAQENLEQGEHAATEVQHGKKKRKKKKLPKAVKIILIILAVILVLLLIGVIIIAVLWGNLVRRVVDFPNQVVLDHYDFVDISMTDEQKLEDLEALYQHAFLENSTYEEREALYGVDYEALYEEYKDIVVNTKNEYEYFCALYVFCSYIGSGHTYMMFPHFAEVINSGFQLNMEALEGVDTAAVYYTWEETLKEQMMEYMSASSSVRYVAGGYYLYGIEGNTIWPDEYLGASVTAINGEDPGEFIVNNPFSYSLEYDDIFEYTYRSYVLFNNEAGTEVVIDIELEDGTTAQVKTFMDSRRELALLLGAYASNFTSNSSVSVVKDNYELVEEEDYIYLRINSCEKSDEDAVMIEALKDALTRHDKIIIDLRDNGGGLLVYFSDCVYPYIFEESFSVETLCSVEKNELSTLWLKDPVIRLLESAKYYRPHNDYHYINTMEYNGESEKTNQVFILVNEGTFSSADTFTYNMSKLDNVTIVGTHTGGEGVEGYIFMYSLPNSRMCYAYTPCKSEETNGANALTGTAPDVVFYQTLEDKREIMRYYSAGINPYSYAVMMEYDDMLLNTVEYVKAYN